MWKNKLVARSYENSFSMTGKHTNASMDFNSKGTNIKFLSKIWKCNFGNQPSPFHYFILNHAFTLNKSRPYSFIKVCITLIPLKAIKLHLSLKQKPRLMLGKGQDKRGVEQVAGKGRAGFVTSLSTPLQGSLCTEKSEIRARDPNNTP